MKGPNVRYYAILEDCTILETPKYKIGPAIGRYEPLSRLVGKDGEVSFYLNRLPSRDPKAPEMRLQGKGSMNFSGLRFIYDEQGRRTNCAYGYPCPADVIKMGKKTVVNPFFGYRKDGYLFKLHYDRGTERPSSIELIVLSDAKAEIPAYCAMLVRGGFSHLAALLRG